MHGSVRGGRLELFPVYVRLPDLSVLLAPHPYRRERLVPGLPQAVPGGPGRLQTAQPRGGGQTEGREETQTPTEEEQDHRGQESVEQHASTAEKLGVCRRTAQSYIGSRSKY